LAVGLARQLGQDQRLGRRGVLATEQVQGRVDRPGLKTTCGVRRVEVELAPMSGETVTGFWSYTHEDNALDDGSILALSDRIKHEYNLLAGEPLGLFVDRDGIAWGDEWRKRIEVISQKLNRTPGH
jgi:hypothetical protein